jgi:hypothetical protein
MPLLSIAAWVIMSPVYFAVILFALLYNGWETVAWLFAFHIFSALCFARIGKGSARGHSGYDRP